VPPEDPGGTIVDPPPSEKIVVKLADGKDRTIRYVAATTYWSHDGRPITAQEFMDQLFGDLGTLVASEDELRTIWGDPARRAAFIQRLAEMGYDANRIEDMQRLIDAPNSDIFDVLAYVRFTLAPLSRSERAETARSRASATTRRKCGSSSISYFAHTRCTASRNWRPQRSPTSSGSGTAGPTTRSAVWARVPRSATRSSASKDISSGKICTAAS
jgi:hypothetical protein